MLSQNTFPSPDSWYLEPAATLSPGFVLFGNFRDGRTFTKSRRTAKPSAIISKRLGVLHAEAPLERASVE